MPSFLSNHLLLFSLKPLDESDQEQGSQVFPVPKNVLQIKTRKFCPSLEEQLWARSVNVYFSQESQRGKSKWEPLNAVLGMGVTNLGKVTNRNKNQIQEGPALNGQEKRHDNNTMTFSRDKAETGKEKTNNQNIALTRNEEN